MSHLADCANGKYETSTEGGSKTMHPYIGHALMHLASEHADGIHMHAHQEKAGGPITVHVMHEDGSIKKHEHKGPEAMAEHAEQFFGGEE